MAGRFSYSRPARRGAADPWFRLGDLDVGSATLLAGLCAASILVYGFEPRDKPILSRLALIPGEVTRGQVWRVFTWPLANGFDGRLLWTAIAVAMLWYFGNRVEEQIGRVKMLVLLAMIIVLPGIVGALLDLPQAGVRVVELSVLLIFIAEYPQMRFFFGIPAWVLGLVFVVTDILQLSGSRANRELLFYLITLALAAVSARSVGMLSAYPWLPHIPLPVGGNGQPKPRSRSRKRRGSKKTNTVVEGPWNTANSLPRPDIAAAQAELDGLLDKISAAGLDSLSAAEKRRLNELSKRLR